MKADKTLTAIEKRAENPEALEPFTLAHCSTSSRSSSRVTPACLRLPNRAIAPPIAI